MGLDTIGRLTAWFLISNSIGPDDDELDGDLRHILFRIMDDADVMERVGEEIEDLLKRTVEW